MYATNLYVFLLVFVPYETVSAWLVMVGILFHVGLKCLCCVNVIVMVNPASSSPSPTSMSKI